MPARPKERAISESLRAETTTSAETSAAVGFHASLRTAKRYRSVAARVIRSPSSPSRIPVSVGRVSSRPAATDTSATASANSCPSTAPSTPGSGGRAG